MSSTGMGQDGPLAMAAEAIARAHDEIDRLWYDSVTTDDDSVAEKLLAVSHAIQGATHLLDGPRSIG